MEFKSDIRDIKFVVFEMLRCQEFARHERYAEATAETLDMVIDEGYTFAREALAPSSEIGDREGCSYEGGQVYMSAEIKKGLKTWGEMGWSGMVENPDWGGQGLPLVTASVLNELFTGANCALSLLPMLTVGAAHLMEGFAPEWLNKLCLEKLYSLEWTGTMCLTEPQAGSDVGASKTKAFKVSDGVYRIVGTKNFITGGDHDGSENIIHVLLARVEGAPKGTRGLSLFVVPKYRINDDGSLGEFNDINAAGIEHKMGIHGTPTCTMNYGDNDDCIGFLVGPENGGMRLMFHLMNEARIWVGMQGLALAAASYQQALEYSRERLQGTDIRELRKPDAQRAAIIRHPDVRRMLMTMKSSTEAMRALFLTVAWMEDMVRIVESDEEKEYYQGLVDLLTPVCKAYGSDTGFELTAVGIQILGGYGYCKEYPLEQLMRDAKIASIYEGTNGIQALDLFTRKVPWKGGKLFGSFMKLIGNFVEENRGKRPCMEDEITALADAAAVLQKTTMELGALAQADLPLGVLQATPYLKMFGHVACALEILKQGVFAHDKLVAIYAEKGAETDEDKLQVYETNAEANFYKGKVLSARFFMKSILPEIYGIQALVGTKDSSPLDVRFGLEEES